MSIESIDTHVRTYRTALQSTLEVTLNSLTNSHLKMEAILHSLGSDSGHVDFDAFIYALQRLPDCLEKCRKIVVGQDPDVFLDGGFKNVRSWPEVSAPARRRTGHYHARSHILALFAASISDIDDLVTSLLAFQIEWNKFHTLLHVYYPTLAKLNIALKEQSLFATFNLEPRAWLNLTTALGPKANLRFRSIYRQILDLRIQLLAGSWVDYTKATQKWWKNIAAIVLSHYSMTRRPVYLVSSNLHSLLNLSTGFILKQEKAITSILKADHPDLYHTWQQIQANQYHLHRNDFLYFASKYLLRQNQSIQHSYLDYQQKLGIITIPNAHCLDITMQMFPLQKLIAAHSLDPRLKISRPQKLADSQALIFNIDYPLGFAAYHILTEAFENLDLIKGIYILGKAAVLNSEVGDIQIPRLVFDEHTQNSYIFKNCFNTYFPFTNKQGSILTNQKAVSVLGTFLQNEALLKKYFDNNITIIEMESGPYLNAITQAVYDQETPNNSVIDLNNARFDIGIINYTSDNPYSKARNLGAAHLSLDGVEPVYLGSLAILQRIIHLEEQS